MSSALSVGAAVLRADPSRLDPVFADLRQRVAAGILPAAALAVGDAEGGIRADAYGAGGTPADPSSNFFLASLTKPIFATAFMQLIESRDVRLDEPVARWLPEFGPGADDARAQVTPRHLLTHTSGVADIDPDLIRRRRPSAKAMTRITLEAPLRFTPGTRWEYCSASFYLLARIIERVTGTDYPTFLRLRLFTPLGMQATFDPRRAGRPIVPVGGVGVDSRLMRFLVARYLAGAAVPGGGLFGNLEDLVRFGAAILWPRSSDGQFVPLDPATIAAMGEDQVRGLRGYYEGEEQPVHFGLGWGKPTLMGELPGPPGVVSHGGASGTRLWIDPDLGLVFVFLTSQWSAERGPETDALLGVYRAMSGS